MSQGVNDELSKGIVNDSVKELANALKKLTLNSEELFDMPEENSIKTEFSNAIEQINKIDNETENYNDEIDLSEAIKEFTNESETYDNGSVFKVVKSNLPAKVNFWTKVRNVLFYEIKVELTPHQQKIEDELNSFLHKEITWESVKNFWTQEVPITYKGKRIF